MAIEDIEDNLTYVEGNLTENINLFDKLHELTEKVETLLIKQSEFEEVIHHNTNDIKRLKEEGIMANKNKVMENVQNYIKKQNNCDEDIVANRIRPMEGKPPWLL